jgi:signal transduction histidine kinase
MEGMMFNSSHTGEPVPWVTQPEGAAVMLNLASQTNGSVPEESEHFVQFYETNAFLLDSLRDFIGLGLVSGDACVVVATDGLRAELDERLEASGLDKFASLASGQYFALNAAETLEKFMVDGSPDPRRFSEVIGGIITQAAQDNRRVRIFGEMVAILWADGNRDAAIRLEELWNGLQETHPFQLFCAYPMNIIGGSTSAVHFGHVCTTHSRVIPAESYMALEGADNRLRKIAELQQQAISLQAEIAERKRAEEDLKQASLRKDEFLAMLAHELRNPLSPILSAVELLRRNGSADPNLQQARNVIERQAQHLTRLVDDLLDTARITQGKITLRKETIELMNVIGRAMETSRPFIEAHGHQLSLSLSQEPLRIEGDLVRLAQAISNLLNNAAKYTEEGGHIWLTAERVETEVVLRVRDNGMGISETLLPHIFDLFSQANRSLDRSEGGLGVGLAIVRSLVKMHGGRVEAFSAGSGQGSEFVVYLPMLTKEAQSREIIPATSAGHAPAPRARRRILVVDDNVDSAQCMELLLKIDGHEVYVAHDGRAAIDTAQMFHPQVVLLDIGLPKMDGYEVAKRLREWPEMQKAVLIALTGYGRAEDHRMSAQAGFDYHLTKPVNPNIVQDIVDSLTPS